MRAIGALALVLVLAACGQPAAEDSTTTLPALSSTTSTSTTTTVTTTTTVATTTSAPGPTGALLVFGSWGSGTMPQGAVAGAMARYAEENEVGAILTTGDNFYSDDADFLMQPMDWAIAAGTPFWITIGEIDVETPERIAVIDETFDEPRPWVTQQWGAVSIIILDSTQVSSAEQTSFIEAELARLDGPTVVVFHHPVYSCTAGTASPEMAERWLPMLDSDVVLVLNGHATNYQRFGAGDATYVVTGGGGAQLEEPGECPADGPELVTGTAIHHFLALSQTDSSIEIDVIDTVGETIESFQVGLD